MFSYGNFWGGGFLLFPVAALGSFIGGHVYEINNDYLWIILSVAVLFNFLLVLKYIKEPGDAET